MICTEAGEERSGHSLCWSPAQSARGETRGSGRRSRASPAAAAGRGRVAVRHAQPRAAGEHGPRPRTPVVRVVVQEVLLGGGGGGQVLGRHGEVLEAGLQKVVRARVQGCREVSRGKGGKCK